MIHTQNEGIYHTLLAQLDKLERHNRQGSYKTRQRYYEAMQRFCRFLADVYHLQKLSNISGKHLVAYVRHLQENGKAASTIKTELAAIRFLHSILLIIEKAAYGLLRFPCAQRGALWYGALCKKEQNAGHTDLTTCAPRFLFCKGRGRTSAELSLDTPGECTIIMCVGKTRKVVFLRNDKMGGNE